MDKELRNAQRLASIETDNPAGRAAVEREENRASAPKCRNCERRLWLDEDGVICDKDADGDLFEVNQCDDCDGPVCDECPVSKTYDGIICDPCCKEVRKANEKEMEEWEEAHRQCPSCGDYLKKEDHAKAKNGQCERCLSVHACVNCGEKRDGPDAPCRGYCYEF